MIIDDSLLTFIRFFDPHIIIDGLRFFFLLVDSVVEIITIESLVSLLFLFFEIESINTIEDSLEHEEVIRIEGSF